jgi:hypothetical protein
MIDWGRVPDGSVASIYLPAATADEILAMAGRLYTSHPLRRADDHTLQCVTGGITYVPIPPGKVNHAGLISVQLPEGLRQERVFSITVRQVTNAFGQQVGEASRPRARAKAKGETTAAVAYTHWRRVLGAFQITIPVKAKPVLLVTEERDLSVLRWIAEAIPQVSRWYPVFHRYLDIVSDRVKAFGGDPAQILPSPAGDGRRKDGGLSKKPEREGLQGFTGKVSGLIYDRFGDFEGFLLDTEDGERKFFSREKEIADLAVRAWRERLRITVFVERHEPHRPARIIVRQPPVSFEV